MTAAPTQAPPAMAGLRAPLAVLAAGAAATAYVGAVDPGQPGHYPSCPFLALTGLACPFCGSLRAVHALVHGDVSTAVGYNALTSLGVVVLVVLWAAWAVRRVRGTPSGVTVPTWLWPALGVVALAFGVLRNLPLGAALAP